jgi:hypothetical protein
VWVDQQDVIKLGAVTKTAGISFVTVNNSVIQVPSEGQAASVSKYWPYLEQSSLMEQIDPQSPFNCVQLHHTSCHLADVVLGYLTNVSRQYERVTTGKITRSAYAFMVPFGGRNYIFKCPDIKGIKTSIVLFNNAVAYNVLRNVVDNVSERNKTIVFQGASLKEKSRAYNQVATLLTLHESVPNKDEVGKKLNAGLELLRVFGNYMFEDTLSFSFQFLRYVTFHYDETKCTGITVKVSSYEHLLIMEDDLPMYQIFHVLAKCYKSYGFDYYHMCKKMNNTYGLNDIELIKIEGWLEKIDFSRNEIDSMIGMLLDCMLLFQQDSPSVMRELEKKLNLQPNDLETCHKGLLFKLVYVHYVELICSKINQSIQSLFGTIPHGDSTITLLEVPDKKQRNNRRLYHDLINDLCIDTNIREESELLRKCRGDNVKLGQNQDNDRVRTLFEQYDDQEIEPTVRIVKQLFRHEYADHEHLTPNKLFRNQVTILERDTLSASDTIFLHCVVHDTGVPPAVKLFNECKNDLLNTGVDKLIDLYNSELVNKISLDKFKLLLPEESLNSELDYRIELSLQIPREEFSVDTDNIYIKRKHIDHVLKRAQESNVEFDASNVQPIFDYYQYLNELGPSWNSNYARVLAELQGKLGKRKPIQEEEMSESESDISIQDELSEDLVPDFDTDPISEPVTLNQERYSIRSGFSHASYHIRTPLEEHLIFTDIDYDLFERCVVNLDGDRKMKKHLLIVMRKVALVPNAIVTQEELTNFLVEFKQLLYYHMLRTVTDKLDQVRYTITRSLQALIRLQIHLNGVTCLESINHILLTKCIHETCYQILEASRSVKKRNLFGGKTVFDDGIDFRYTVQYLCVILIQEAMYDQECVQYYSTCIDTHSGYPLFWTLFRAYKQALDVKIRLSGEYEASIAANSTAAYEMCEKLLASMILVATKKDLLPERLTIYERIYDWYCYLTMSHEELEELKPPRRSWYPFDIICPTIVSMIQHQVDENSQDNVFKLITTLYPIFKDDPQSQTVVATMVMQIPIRDASYSSHLVNALVTMQEYFDTNKSIKDWRKKGPLEYAYTYELVEMLLSKLNGDDFDSRAVPIMYLACLYKQVEKQIRKDVGKELEQVFNSVLVSNDNWYDFVEAWRDARV